MDQHARAQIRLILEDADARTKKAVDDRLKAIYADHAARGLLQSGATVKVALAGIEEIASKFINCVDHVATIAKDIEAFAMIQETVEAFLRFLAGRVEDAAAMATGNSRQGSTFEPVFKAAQTRFADSQQQLQRQLEIQRFTFSVAYKPLATASEPARAAAAPSLRALGVGVTERRDGHGMKVNIENLASPATSAAQPHAPSTTSHGANVASGATPPVPQANEPSSAEDWQAAFDERAGIAEFDGGLSREDAERLASVPQTAVAQGAGG